jgi:hypothetical protein
LKGKDNKFFFGIEKDGMDINEYLKCINNISEYYFLRCEKYKKRFYFSCFVRIVASALIPIISLATEVNASTVCVSILASVIMISESYVNVTQAHEKWTKYRTTCNLLWVEARSFSMKAGRYSDENTRVEEFVNRCESLMIKETNEWKNYIEKVKEIK